jgi:catechol 2,3-dioxygenase-like lactoylglutathione lyase family enzyme
MVTALSHYNLRAPRPLLDQLCRFYCDVVGLTNGRRPAFPSSGYWLYAGDVPVLHLTECSPGEERIGTRPATFDHAAFACADRAATEARLSGLGVTYEVDHVPGSGEAQLFFVDPAGNGVELIFPPGD